MGDCNSCISYCCNLRTQQTIIVDVRSSSGPFRFVYLFMNLIRKHLYYRTKMQYFVIWWLFKTVVLLNYLKKINLSSISWVLLDPGSLQFFLLSSCILLDIKQGKLTSSRVSWAPLEEIYLKQGELTSSRVSWPPVG